MEKTPKTQATTTMKNITFDGMPVALASLHEKCDTIIALLSNIASGSSGAPMHTPVGMTEASKLLGKSPSTIYEMTSKRKIPFHKRGNKLYFFQDEPLKWITDGGCKLILTIPTAVMLTLMTSRPRNISKSYRRRSDTNLNL